MNVDVETRPWAPGRLPLRLAAALLMHEGVMPERVARQWADAVRTGGRRKPGEMVNEAMRPLIDDGLAVRVDGVWYATNLADLAAWMADGFEAREDLGIHTDPVIPSPREAYSAA